MDAATLRAHQAPIKQAYKDDATAAQVTLTSQGSLDDGLSCSLSVGGAIKKAGLHKMAGGVDTSQL